ncbi:MAG: DsbA family protein [Gemmatimonadaceae bacterium]
MLALVATVGVAAIVYAATRPDAAPVTTVADGTPLPEAQGYLLGDPNAPVQIIEFADFQCPACATFAIVTEPDVRERLVNTGQASYRFFDFPLPQHQNSIEASLAAACANEQAKFWEMHDGIFRQQNEWMFERNPKDVFEGVAQRIGLDAERWESCYDSREYERQILANKAAGERRGIQSTPTFIIGGRMTAGSISYDAIKALVDSAAARAPSNDTAALPPAPSGSSADAG